MRVVVLGDGLLGLPAADAFRAGGHDVEAWSRARLDLTRPVPVDAFSGRDLVVNTMAVTNVDRAQEQPAEAFRVNAEAAGEVARAAAAAGAALQHVSTDYAIAPVNVYGESKREGERRVLEAAPGALVVRVSTTFGPHPRRRDFVRWVLGALREKGEATVLADMWSSPTYAVDAARFLVEASERRPRGIVHVSNAAVVSRLDIARAAQDAFGVPGTLHPGSFAQFKWGAPRAQDTRMPQDAPAWWRPRALADCMRDYARREGVKP